jgi:hypothetical protein
LAREPGLSALDEGRNPFDEVWPAGASADGLGLGRDLPADVVLERD